MPQTKNSAKRVTRFYVQHMLRYPKLVVGLAIGSPLAALINGYLPPLILAHVLNRLSRHDYQPHEVWASFGPELVGYALLVLIGGAVMWRVVDVFAFRLEENVLRDMAREAFGHLVRLDANFHANTFGGSLVSQNSKLLGSYIRFSDSFVFQILPMLASFVFAALFLAGRAPMFVVALLVFSMFYIASSFFVTRPVRKLATKHATAESKQTGYLADMITNVMAVKSFAGSTYENQAFASITNHTRQRLINFSRGHHKQQIYFSTVASAISGMSLTMAVISIVAFGANLATVFLILNYTANIVSQLFTFSNNSLRTLNRAFGDAADMIAVLDTEPEVADPEQPEKVRIARGAINFHDVTFQHNGAHEPIFDSFNLQIKPGEKVGLVGHSGSGKTTFTRLILRFSDIQSGEILIDGQNIAHITQDDLRRHIAYVPQEPLLFHRTIRENIGYGQDKPDQKSIEGVAKFAHADEFIRTLPQGYETLVGERGVKLSGGQRQRIAIARAMLKNAPILLLDEATSALDSESEVLIQDALWKLMEGRTAVVIAHRLSTIQKMDRIVVMDDGKIVEQGSHKELLRQNGTYAKLWAHQSGGFIDD